MLFHRWRWGCAGPVQVAGTPEAGDAFNSLVLPDVADSFDVYASCPVRTDATRAATYTINHSPGAATKTVDQKSVVHGFDDLIPADQAGRFLSRKGVVPTTWGEAIANRIGKHSAG